MCEKISTSTALVINGNLGLLSPFPRCDQFSIDNTHFPHPLCSTLILKTFPLH